MPHVTHASIGPPESTTRSVRQFLDSSRQNSVRHVGICPYPLKNASSHGRSRPHLIRGSLGPPDLASKRHIDRFRCFCTAPAECPYTLRWAAPPPQNCPFPPGSGPPSNNTWFLGSPESSTETAFRLVQPFLQSSLV